MWAAMMTFGSGGDRMGHMVAEGELLWEPTPSVVANAKITRYLASVGRADYQDAWQWSVEDPAAFWTSVWDYFGVVGERGDGPVMTGTMPGVEWFTGSSLNYAENALRRADGPAVIFHSEGGTAPRHQHARAPRRGRAGQDRPGQAGGAQGRQGGGLPAEHP
ncbi:hypothetical protein GCM10020219_016310 [Nonomuraea dietziae]